MRFSGIKHRFRPWFMVWIIVMWCLSLIHISEPTRPY